jgi:hypothetical protein
LILKTYEACSKHLLEHMPGESLAREKILNVFRWLFSVKPSDPSKHQIMAYTTEEPGIRFCCEKPGTDHFLCVKYRKMSAEMHFYTNKVNFNPKRLPYVNIVSDNPNWLRINSTDVANLKLNIIKAQVRKSYRQRFGELRVTP